MQDGKVLGYVANQLGFSEIGRIMLYHLLPGIKTAGIEPIEPFELGRPHYPEKELNDAQSHEERRKLLTEFNSKVAVMNKKSMKDSDIMLPILDGGHVVDDGTACEIGHYAAHKYGPIIALRTDFRLSENEAACVNPQIESDIKESGGMICTSLEKWYNGMGNAAKRIRAGRS